MKCQEFKVPKFEWPGDPVKAARFIEGGQGGKGGPRGEVEF